MQLSPKAEKRFKKLLPKNAKGFSVTGFIGTCRGSTPALKPAQAPQPGQQTFETSGLVFFLNRDIADRFRDCSIDYDGSFFGKGLTVTLPNCDSCSCRS